MSCFLIFTCFLYLLIFQNPVLESILMLRLSLRCTLLAEKISFKLHFGIKIVVKLCQFFADFLPRYKISILLITMWCKNLFHHNDLLYFLFFLPIPIMFVVNSLIFPLFSFLLQRSFNIIPCITFLYLILTQAFSHYLCINWSLLQLP